ncbi:MAG: anti-sigma factor [Intrasporangium sp.]|uniref:anti-sigma factor n=1 Tax=Intrasporangium sp. TaxID=1925024 RepID=UPI00264723A6|nr:anti-sigma factor [Intrasporangium sp.]MDN5796188.1 anti-sigma factor [Intrasporangium sp.]
MPHPDDEMLAALASGEPVPAEVTDHVSDCPTCAADIAAVRHVLAVARTVESVPSWDAPPDGVWGAIVAEVDAEPAGDVAPHRSSAPLRTVAQRDTSDGHISPAGTAADAGTAAERRSPHGWMKNKRLLRWTVGAAAAGLLVGILGGRLVDQQPQTGVTVSSVALDTLDTQQRVGSAQVLRMDNRLNLKIETTPLEAPHDEYLEVWLINTDKKRMVSVGILGSGEQAASFPIQPDLLEQGYTIVDISREPLDDKPAHSGDSLARGKLPV